VGFVAYWASNLRRNTANGGAPTAQTRSCESVAAQCNSTPLTGNGAYSLGASVGSGRSESTDVASAGSLIRAAELPTDTRNEARRPNAWAIQHVQIRAGWPD
jgi:hypothetical protein